MPIKIQLIGADALVKIGMLAKQQREQLLQNLTKAANDFTLYAVYIAKTKYLSGPKPEKLAAPTGRLRSSVVQETKREGEVISTSIGSNVIYAAIHELGGQIEATPSMWGFFWHKFKSTKDDKWKWMALSLRKKGFITIPARPYLRPSLEEALPSFKNNIATLLRKLNFTGESQAPGFEA